MDAKTLERVLPLVQALKAKGVEPWKALEIAAQCGPAVDRIAQAVTDIEFATDTRLSTNEVLALIAQCLKAPDGDASSAEAPATSTAAHRDLVRTLAMPIEELDLAARTEKSLLAAGILHVIDLVQKSESALGGLGQKSLKEIKEELRLKSLRLGMKLDSLPIGEVDNEIVRQERAARSRTTASPR